MGMEDRTAGRGRVAAAELLIFQTRASGVNNKTSPTYQRTNKQNLF